MTHADHHRHAVAIARALRSTVAMAALRDELEAARQAAGADDVGDPIVAWEDDAELAPPPPIRRRYQPGAWHRRLGAELDGFARAIELGYAPRAILSAPPRHGKTLHVSSMAAALMARNRGFRALYATSTDDRARDVSLSVRRLIEALHAEDPQGFAHLAPGDRWTDTDWSTVGGCRFLAIGAGVATGGIGAQLVLIDDVVGSRARAISRAWRERMQEWLAEDILSRVEGAGGILDMATRRHEDDDAGWLMRTQPGRWRQLIYRTVAEAGDTDGRQPGEYLWPEVYGATWRAQHPELADGSRVWISLHQQRPQAEGGLAWPIEYLSTRYSLPPDEQARLCDQRALVVDGAATGGGGDHTVIQHWGWIGPRSYLLGQWRGQWAYPELRTMLLDLHASLRPNAVVLEDASSGRPVGQELERTLPGVERIPARGSKLARWEAVQPQHAAGQVHLPEPHHAPWVGGMVGRLLVLVGQGDEVDDEADTMALALSWRVSNAIPTVQRTTLSGLRGR